MANPRSQHVDYAQWLGANSEESARDMERLLAKRQAGLASAQAQHQAQAKQAYGAGYGGQELDKPTQTEVQAGYDAYGGDLGQLGQVGGVSALANAGNQSAPLSSFGQWLSGVSAQHGGAGQLAQAQQQWTQAQQQRAQLDDSIRSDYARGQSVAKADANRTKMFSAAKAAQAQAEQQSQAQAQQQAAEAKRALYAEYARSMGYEPGSVDPDAALREPGTGFADWLRRTGKQYPGSSAYGTTASDWGRRLGGA